MIYSVFTQCNFVQAFKKKQHPWNFSIQDYKCSVWKQVSAVLSTEQIDSCICLLRAMPYPSHSPRSQSLRACAFLSSWYKRGLTASEVGMAKIITKNPSYSFVPYCFRTPKQWILRRKNMHPILAVLSYLVWMCPEIVVSSIYEQPNIVVFLCEFWKQEIVSQWEQSSLQSCCWDVFSLSGLWILLLLIY